MRPVAADGPFAEMLPANSAPAKQPHILVVDDDPMVLNLLQIVLQQKGFAVQLAAGGKAALDVYRTTPERIDLVLLDVCMPGLDGPATLREMQRIHPGVVACFMSGYTGRYTLQDLRQCGGVDFFSKPFRMDETAQALWQLAHGDSRMSA